MVFQTDGAVFGTCRVSVVIPALDEAENLPHVLPRIPTWVHEVILVDGHSTDDTAETAMRLWPSIRLITQEGRGKGAALRTGFRAATGDIVVMLDADGSTDPAEIPAFVGALLAGADFAKGSRFLQGSGTADMPLYRRVGNTAFVKLTNLLFGTRFTDITYGYNAVWRQHDQALALEIDGWAQEIIANIRVARAGLRIVEVGSYEYRRVAGMAKLKTFSAGWVILKAILVEAIRPAPRRVRRRRPVAPPGAVATTAPSWAAAADRRAAGALDQQRPSPGAPDAMPPLPSIPEAPDLLSRTSDD
jgi:glycosyltransferase involved in cell wall biosynthesis